MSASPDNASIGIDGLPPTEWAQLLRDLAERLSASQLYELREQAQRHLDAACGAGGKAPRIIVEEAPDGEQIGVCPYCQHLFTDLTVEDLSLRWTDFTLEPAEARISGLYGSAGDYCDSIYLCARCRQPLSLPDGYTEEPL